MSEQEAIDKIVLTWLTADADLDELADRLVAVISDALLETCPEYTREQHIEACTRLAVLVGRRLDAIKGTGGGDVGNA